MVSVEARRSGVAFATSHGLSQRRASTLLHIARGSLSYESRKLLEDAPVIEQMKSRAGQLPRFGYRRIRIYLGRDGIKLSVNRMYRLWRVAKLQLPKKRPRKRIRGVARDKVERPAVANEVWSYDFVFDTAANGQKVKCLTVVDEGTRESLAIDVGRSIRSRRVIEVLSRLVSERGAPTTLRSDNGPEFVSHALLAWIVSEGIRTGLIEPGKPWQNGTCESFSGRFRDECLSVEWFRSREEARVLIEKWRKHYNEDRPHSSLDNMTPSDYAARLACGEIAPILKPQRTWPARGRSAACDGHSTARPLAPSETVVQLDWTGTRDGVGSSGGFK